MRAKNRLLEIDAAEIRIRAVRRLGEMLRETEKNKGTAGLGRPSLGGITKEPPKTPTLSSLGIDKKLSSLAQKLAAVSEEKFEEMIEEWKEKERGVLNFSTPHLNRATCLSVTIPHLSF